jgi:cell division protein YceG involved in septum cleavage
MDNTLKNDKNSNGAIIATIIVIIVLILGAFYFWGKQMSTPTEPVSIPVKKTVVIKDDVGTLQNEVSNIPMTEVNLDEPSI